MQHIRTFLFPKRSFYILTTDENALQIITSKVPPDFEHFLKSNGISYEPVPNTVLEKFAIELEVYPNFDEKDGMYEATLISNPNITIQQIINKTGEMDELKFYETGPAFRNLGE
jgi:hypothetical protein